METYCQNTFCETAAVGKVPVSVNKPSDETRALCAACKEAYTWGVQHGKKVSQERKLWILAVADRGIIAHIRACKSKTEAEKAMVEYLQKNENCSCANDINLAYLWLNEHDERLSVEIAEQDICFDYC